MFIPFKILLCTTSDGQILNEKFVENEKEHAAIRGYACNVLCRVNGLFRQDYGKGNKEENWIVKLANENRNHSRRAVGSFQTSDISQFCLVDTDAEQRVFIPPILSCDGLIHDILMRMTR